MKTLLILAFLAVSSSLAVASPTTLTVQARMFLRDKGELDDDLLKGTSSAKVGNLDYGELAGEMLVSVSVPDGVGDQLTVTIKQGKMELKQVWKVTVGKVYGIARAHYPLLVRPTFCGGPMTITAKIGTVTEKRTIDFTCSE